MFAKYKKIIRWSLAEQAITMLAGFFSISLINNLFGKDTYGEMVFFQSIFAYILILATLGFDKTIVFKLSHYSESKTKLFGKNLLLSTQRYSFIFLALAELLFVGAWHIFSEGRFSNEYFWIILFGFNAFLSVTIVLYTAYFQANKFSDFALKIQVINSSLKILILIIFYFINFDSFIYFFVYIIFPATISIIQFIIIDKKHSENSQDAIDQPTKKDISYSVKLMLTQFVYQGIEKIDLIMVGIYLSATFVAEYSVAAKLAILILLGNNLLSPLFSPRMKFAIANKSEEDTIKEYNFNKYFSTFFSLFFIVVFLLFGKKILLLFGDYERGYNLLIMLSLAFFNQNAFGPNGRFLMLRGYASLTLVTTIITLAMLLILNVILIPKMGAIGAAFGTFIAIISLNIMLQVYIFVKEKVAFSRLPYYSAILLINFVVIGVTFG